MFVEQHARETGPEGFEIARSEVFHLVSAKAYGDRISGTTDHMLPPGHQLLVDHLACEIFSGLRYEYSWIRSA